MEKKTVRKTTRQKAHTRYKNAKGKGVPGTTTVLGKLAKPALVPWANKLGLQGIDCRSYVDDKAAIGTLAHAMVIDGLAGKKTDTDEYSKEQIDQAENSLLSFYEWEKANKITPVQMEVPLVSEEYQFGGTPDIYCMVDDKPVLIDIKTSKAIYTEMSYQLAAYVILLRENGMPVTDARILRIGRNEDEGFEVRRWDSLERETEIFKHLLAIYHLEKTNQTKRNNRA